MSLPSLVQDFYMEPQTDILSANHGARGSAVTEGRE